MICFRNKLAIITLVYAWILPGICLADDIPKGSKVVSVIITDTEETEWIELKGRQTAQIKVYLSSLGDMLDEYMVSLIDTSRKKPLLSLISDTSGIVIFRKVPPGNYAVFVNQKVTTEEQEHNTIKVSDIVMKAYP